VIADGTDGTDGDDTMASGATDGGATAGGAVWTDEHRTEGEAEGGAQEGRRRLPAGGRRPAGGRSKVVVKIGTSSLTDESGAIVRPAIAKLCAEVAEVRAGGDDVVIVSSGAIGAGLPVLGLGGDRRPRDAVTLQAVSAVGQSRLLQVYGDELATHGLVAGQVLLTPLDFMVRRQYLQARGTLTRLLELGVVPVVNENDAIADDEIRFGDNDRIGALVAHLLGASLLVLLTDTPGLVTADPRLDTSASLIEEIVEVDQALEAVAGGAGTVRGSGGMASKLAAAKIAAWSGVRTVIAAAHRERALVDAVAGGHGVGTVVVPRDRRLPARKLWIAFAVGARGTVVVDAGARRALEAGGASLLAAGVTGVTGDFDADEPVEIADQEGRVFAKGLARADAATIKDLAGRRSGDLPEGVAAEVVHRDDLVVLP
jgi:glutamate 5-kinase